MAKQQTICGCGGSFDGTPSGLKKHNLTTKHVGWVAGQQKAAKATNRREVLDAAAGRAVEAVLGAAPTDAQVDAALGSAPATEPQAKAQAKPARTSKAKQADDLTEAKAAVAKFKRYVAYAAKEANHVKPENKAKYAQQLAEAEARVAELTV